MYDDFAKLRIGRDGHLLRIVIDNPPNNGIDPELHRELSLVFRRVQADRQARAVVLTGTGQEGFCAAGDIDRIAANLDNHAHWNNSVAEARELVLSMLDLDKPVVARINGHAIGFGATLALLCDITVASTKAKIADPHVRMGLVAGDGGAFIWPQLIGFARAREYLLTGRALSATEAAAIGLINHAVEPDALDAKVQEFVDWFENGPGTAISLTKKSINMLLKQHATALVEAHYGLEAQSIFSGDHREAVSAFLEGRDPRFE